MKRLEGKAAIVTGAGTGIGEAIAHKFALEGAHVLVSGLPGDPVEAVASAIREQYPDVRVEFLAADVAEHRQKLSVAREELEGVLGKSFSQDTSNGQSPALAGLVP